MLPDIFYKRKVNVWLEDWEKELARKNDPVVRERFLQKYKDLQWWDPDKSLMVVATKMQYYARSGGWQIMTRPKGQQDVADSDLEPWGPDIALECLQFGETGKDHNGGDMPRVQQPLELGLRMFLPDQEKETE